MSKSKKIAAVLGIAAILVLCVVPIASAHTSSLTASLDCNGTVTWTANGSTFNDATITVSDMFGNSATGRLDSTDGHTFSGSFTIPTSATSDEIEGDVTWDDGFVGGQPDPVTVHRPTNCKSTPSISTSLSSSSISVGGSAHDSATLSGATATAGGTVTYSVYSDSSCSQNQQGAGTVTVSSGSVPNSSSLTFNTAGTYYWQAVYSGDSQNSGATSPCTSEQLVVGRGQPSVSTSLSASTISVGGSVHDSATLSGATPTAGGTVTYTVFSDSECSQNAQSAGTVTVSSGSVPNSGSLTFNTAGTYYWQASYSGDTNNAAATSPCTSETLVVNHATPSVSTTLSASTISVGGSVHDSATLSGATATAGGTVTYTVFSDSECSQNAQSAGTVTVSSGSVPNSGSLTFNTAGTYYWQASYSGDTNNAAATSPCTSETLVVNHATPSVSTTLSASTISVGGSVHDSATLSGATATAGGTVTYTVYSNSSCTTGAQGAGTVTVSSGSVPNSSSLTFNTAGTYYWQASYSGDTNNAAATSPCTSEVLTVNSPPPTPSVSSPAISITKNPKSQTIASGGTANFTIVVTNTGNATLTNVTVSDSLAPGCNASGSTIQALLSMAPGASVTYNCSLASVTASFTNSATATGTPPSGPNVTATDTAPVTVTPPPTPAPAPAPTHPAIAIVKSPASQTIATGGTATFKITVTNTGDVTLTDVTVSDPLSTGCNRSLGTLTAGQSKSYTCSKHNVSAGFENVASATGKPPTGAAVKASDHANVSAQPFVPPQAPRIKIEKSPKSQTLKTEVARSTTAAGGTKTTVAYGTAHFTIKVTNSGNTALHDVTVSDPLSTSCDHNLGSMAAGTSKSYSCSRSAVSASFTNVATATGTSPKGTKVEASDHAHVTVKVKTTNSRGAEFTG